MEKQTNKIIGLTLAVHEMTEMLKFYSIVFEMKFQCEEISGHKLYRGKLGLIDILLCPAQLAKNMASQNRHQLEILVQDIHASIKLASIYAYDILEEISEEKGYFSVCIYDPDKNSIILKQKS